MKKLFASLLVLSFFFAHSQYDPTKINKKAVDLFQKGLQKGEAGNYTEAMNYFRQSLAIDSNYVHAHLAIAALYAKMKEFKKSTDESEKAFAIDPNYTAEDRLGYSVNLSWQGRFEEALAAVNFMLNKPDLNSQMRTYGEAR